MLTVSVALITITTSKLASVQYMGNISSKFSGDSEANASESPENIEEMFPTEM